MEAYGGDIPVSSRSGGSSFSASPSGRTRPKKKPVTKKCDFWLRQRCLTLIRHPYFESFTMFVIVLNSVILALADYRHVDSRGNLVDEGSPRNTLVSKSDLAFIIFFAVEFVVKVLALGFTGPESYISDAWNWLDLIVVISGLISLVPGIPNIKVLRTFRVLRPLKSINAFPVLARGVSSMIRAVFEMGEVAVIIVGVFIFFGICGLQLFSGPYMHARCRLTPYPVNISWHEGLPYEPYRCLDVPLFNTVSSANPVQWTKASSPWATPQKHCFWPLDEGDERLCSLTDGSGSHVCYHSVDLIPEEEWRWCGADFDALGNPRFGASSHDKATFFESLNFGYYNFDHMGNAMLIVFQSLTENGWAKIMYSVMDSNITELAAVYFACIVVVGAYVILELIIAVLEESIAEAERDDIAGRLEEALPEVAHKFDTAIHEHKHPKWINTIYDSIVNFGVPPPGSFRERIAMLTQNGHYSKVVAVIIFINTVVLAIDHYPMNSDFANTIDAMDFLLTILFAVDSGIILFAFGWRYYFFKDLFHFCDALIVALSLAYLIVNPVPTFLDPVTRHHDSTGSITAFRSFRLFRLLRIFKSQTLKKLLIKIIRCLISMANFVVLLILYLFVFSLIGQEFFANKLRFDNDGYAIKEIHSEEWFAAHHKPRFNCDDFSHAFATIFQLLTFDLLSEVVTAYARVSSGAIMFPVLCIIMGAFIMYNLFLAILISNFMNDNFHDMEEEVMETHHKVHPAESYEAADDSKHSVGPIAPAPAFPEMYRALSITDGLLPPVGGPDFIEHNTGRIQAETAPKEKQQGDTVEKPESPVQSVVPADGEQFQNLNDVPDKPDGSIAVLQRRLSALGDLDKRVSLKVKELQLEKKPVFRQALSLFQYVREQSQFLINDYYFEGFIFCLIVISCVALALDNPLLDPNSQKVKNLHIIDEVMVYAFLAEMAMKLIVFGVIGKGSYFADLWNWVDSFVVVTSLLYLNAGDNAVLKHLKPLRALRAFRPLRLINRLPGLKKIVTSLVASIPEVINVVAIVILIHFVFSIFLVSYMKGQLRSCQGDVFTNVISHTSSYLSAVEHPHVYAPFHELLANLTNSTNSTHFANTTNVTHHSHVVLNFPLEYTRVLSSSSHDDDHTTDPDIFGPSSHVAEYYGYHGGHSSTSTFSCTGEHGLTYPETPCCIEPRYSKVLRSATKPTSRMVCECWGGEWKPTSDRLFDNVPQALLVLFQIATGEGWVNQMYAVVDSRGIDMQPIRDYNPSWIYFFLGFMLVGSFLAINLFVGVITETFQKNGSGDEQLLTPEQQEWVKTKRLILSLKPNKELREHTDWHSYFKNLLHHPYINGFFTMAVVAQCVVLASFHFGQDDKVEFILDTADNVLIVIFMTEVILKLAAFGVYAYFDNHWNKFDFIVSIGSFIPFVYVAATNGNLVSVGSFLRVFRLARLLKSFSFTLRDMFSALFVALPYVINIVLLLVLILYIFAVIGMDVFAKTAYYKTYDDLANFRTFGSSILTLFTFTADGKWTDFMYHASHRMPGCKSDPEYDPKTCGFNDFPGCEPLNGCGQDGIFAFIIIYMTIMLFVLLNIFVGVVVFEWGAIKRIAIRPQDFVTFSTHWAKFDPKGKAFIEIKQLEPFICSLPLPLGLYGLGTLELSAIEHRIRKLRVSRTGKVFFSDLLIVLSAACYYDRHVYVEDGHFVEYDEHHVPHELHAYHINTAFDLTNRLQRLHIPGTNSAHIDSPYVEDLSGRAYTHLQFAAARKIQVNWRKTKPLLQLKLQTRKRANKPTDLRNDVEEIQEDRRDADAQETEERFHSSEEEKREVRASGSSADVEMVPMPSQAFVEREEVEDVDRVHTV